MNIIEELGNPFPFISSQVRNLGVIIDSLIWSLGTVFINYVSFPNLNPFCLFKIWRRFFMLYCSITVILCIPQSSPTVGTKCSCKAADRGKEICQFYPHYTGFRSILEFSLRFCCLFLKLLTIELRLILKFFLSLCQPLTGLFYLSLVLV